MTKKRRLQTELIARARASDQTTFQNSDRLPDDEGVVFVTDVPDAPLQCLGRLGRDGRWYIANFMIAPLGRDFCLPPAGVLVLREEPVAEAMIRYGIDQALTAALAGRAVPGFADFKRRLATSRFRERS